MLAAEERFAEELLLEELLSLELVPPDRLELVPPDRRLDFADEDEAEPDELVLLRLLLVFDSAIFDHLVTLRELLLAKALPLLGRSLPRDRKSVE